VPRVSDRADLLHRVRAAPAAEREFFLRRGCVKRDVDALSALSRGEAPQNVHVEAVLR
jgi:hypothetical protein